MALLHDKDWSGLIFLHRGYYAGAVFRFVISIPPDYPSRAPSVFFTPPNSVFHPLVDPATGRFALGGRFPRWREGKDYIFMILHFMKASFKRAALDSLQEKACLNKEAYRYRDQTATFAKLATQCVNLSITESSLFSPPPPPPSAPFHAQPIKFKKLNDEEVAKARKELEERVAIRKNADSGGGGGVEVHDGEPERERKVVIVEESEDDVPIS